jgi:hypothetical protein
VGEDSARTRGKNRSHPATLLAETLVTERKHALEKGNQQTSLYPTVDQRFPHAKAKKLSMGDHAVLSLREVTDRKGRLPILHPNHPPAQPRTASTFLPPRPES